MAISLYAVNEGFIDDVDVKKVVDYEAALHAYVGTNHAELMDTINATGDYNDDIANGLDKAIKDFKTNGAY